MIRVKPEHAVALGYCAQGVRIWFKRKAHTGLRIEQFVNGGIPVEDVLAVDDYMAQELAKEAIKWAEKAED